MTHMFPWWCFKHDLLIQSQLTALNAQQLACAKKIGQTEANKVMTACVGGGFAQWTDFNPHPQSDPTSIGKYQFAPDQTWALLPQLGIQKPMVLTRQDVDAITANYVAAFQGYFQSDQYYTDLEETRSLGGAASTERSDHDSETAKFYAGSAGTSMSAGIWYNISIAALPDDYSIWKQARYFAMMTATMSDAFTACFRTKYEVLFWRPITAINEDDGSGRYTPDPNWRTFLPTQFHPSYPSGHSCSSSAALEALIYELGTSQVDVSVTSEEVPGAVRSFTDLRDVLAETTWSRIVGGLHFRNDNDKGVLLGQDVFKIIASKFA